MERDTKALERRREEASKEHMKHEKMRTAFDATVRVMGLLTSARLL